MVESKSTKLNHKMRVKLLLKGKDAKDIFAALNIPDKADSLLTKPIEKYVRQFAKQKDIFVAYISVDSYSIDAARILSDFRDNVLEECGGSALMLEDGPSEKFEQVLYELIATFERRFRELLIVGICNEKSSLDDKLIEKLGEKSLGELFVLVFTDPEFNSRIKDVVNNKKSRPFEKYELVRVIEQTKENTVWSHYFNDAVLSTVAKEHEAIRIYRNEVMHAHRMSYQKYRSARALIENANKEMVREINARSIYLDVADIATAFSGLSDSISKMITQLDLSGIAQSVQTVQQTLASSALGITPQCDGINIALSESLKPLLGSLAAASAYNASINSLSRSVVTSEVDAMNSADTKEESAAENAQASMDEHSSRADNEDILDIEGPEKEGKGLV